MISSVLKPLKSLCGKFLFLQEVRGVELERPRGTLPPSYFLSYFGALKYPSHSKETPTQRKIDKAVILLACF